ncbi:hypothetical protein H311_04385 [Anncaliia algerae PRA109]|uniref:Transcription initiation factor IIA subunit 1 n=1 Tax=Anncaliia algerae PRA339 TaxID=1288291 RepID=A0A059F1G6_9MICR|nr:hypothetical protein H311_04385 [Anncaliia algerae PRA109]KCZ80821.1 hypothetical protein H312_01768 [Anncaliia algerae PRA339]
MNFEINRVYRFIIEEVCRTVEDESILTNIDSVALKELKTGWYEKLAEYTDLSNMPDMNRPISHLDFEPNYNNMMMLDNDVYMDDIRSSETVEENCDNLFMCLYVKVNKSKNKWKCQFKDGFVNIGPMDFAFSTAQGDLLW